MGRPRKDALPDLAALVKRRDQYRANMEMTQALIDQMVRAERAKIAAMEMEAAKRNEALQAALSSAEAPTREDGGVPMPGEPETASLGSLTHEAAKGCAATSAETHTWPELPDIPAVCDRRRAREA